MYEEKNLWWIERREKICCSLPHRCAPKQFMDLCIIIKQREDKMRRLKDIGFDKLVNISCPQINRDFCRELIRAFDAPTNKIRIRGQTCSLGPNDVKSIMGLPCGKMEIKLNIKDDDEDYLELRRTCGKIPYKEIANWLINEVDDENFEFLFVMYALGTLLCPGAGIFVSDTVLKVMLKTSDAFQEYNWCSFVLNELCKSIGRFKKALRKGKGKVCGRQTVRGCIYFLMIYCLQHFPFGKDKATKVENAIEYWDEKKVKERIQMERDSNDGLLLGVSNVVGPLNGEFNEDLLVHTGLRRAYGTFVSIMEDAKSRMGKELLAIQSDWLNGTVNKEQAEKSHKDVGNDIEEIQETDQEDDNEGYFEGDQHNDEDDLEVEENEEAGEEQDGENEDEADSEKENNENDNNENIESSEEDSKEEVNEEAEEDENTLDESNEQKEENEEGATTLRRSTRVLIPAIVSPWIETKRKGRVKREIEERDALYQMCMARCNNKEGDKYFVEMFGYYLKRNELHCLRRNSWISDKFMSMVAKTLVGDEKEQYGQVRRHIFSADFMTKMRNKLIGWSVKDDERQILPQHLGYNIGDCDLVFGPTIFEDHWFCYVLEPKTLRFYVLDSLVEHTEFIKIQMEQEAAAKEGKKQKVSRNSRKKGTLEPKRFLARSIKGCFFEVLRKVKPSLFHKNYKIDDQVIWAKVHVQPDLDSCGVHVLSWLQMWDGKEQDNEGYTMLKYSLEDLQELKKGCLWWLVNLPTMYIVPMFCQCWEGSIKRGSSI